MDSHGNELKSNPSISDIPPRLRTLLAEVIGKPRDRSALEKNAFRLFAVLLGGVGAPVEALLQHIRQARNHLDSRLRIRLGFKFENSSGTFIFSFWSTTVVPGSALWTSCSLHRV